MSESARFSTVTVGDRIELAKEPISTVQLVMYAGASGDFNRIHYDLPFAQEAGLGGVIAHGMLTVGFLGQLLGQWIGPEGQVADLSARLLKPVRPGDTCLLSARVTAKIDEERTVQCDLEGHVGVAQVVAGRATLQLAP